MPIPISSIAAVAIYGAAFVFHMKSSQRSEAVVWNSNCAPGLVFLPKIVPACNSYHRVGGGADMHRQAFGQNEPEHAHEHDIE